MLPQRRIKTLMDCSTACSCSLVAKKGSSYRSWNRGFDIILSDKADWSTETIWFFRYHTGFSNQGRTKLRVFRGAIEQKSTLLSPILTRNLFECLSILAGRIVRRIIAQIRPNRCNSLSAPSSHRMERKGRMPHSLDEWRLWVSGRRQARQELRNPITRIWNRSKRLRESCPWPNFLFHIPKFKNQNLQVGFSQPRRPLLKLMNDAFGLEFRYSLEFLIKCSIGCSSSMLSMYCIRHSGTCVRVSNAHNLPLVSPSRWHHRCFGSPISYYWRTNPPQSCCVIVANRKSSDRLKTRKKRKQRIIRDLA